MFSIVAYYNFLRFLKELQKINWCIILSLALLVLIRGTRYTATMAEHHTAGSEIPWSHTAWSNWIWSKTGLCGGCGRRTAHTQSSVACQKRRRWRPFTLIRQRRKNQLYKSQQFWPSITNVAMHVPSEIIASAKEGMLWPLRICLWANSTSSERILKRIQEILKVSLRDRGDFKNFAGSAALAEVCGLLSASGLLID